MGVPTGGRGDPARDVLACECHPAADDQQVECKARGGVPTSAQSFILVLFCVDRTPHLRYSCARTTHLVLTCDVVRGSRRFRP